MALTFRVVLDARDGSPLKELKRLVDLHEWENPCLKATVLIALAISLRSEQNSSEGKMNRQNCNIYVMVVNSGSSSFFDFNEQQLADEAIDNMALEGLHAFVAKAPRLENYSFTIDVLDSMLKNFICHFKHKVNPSIYKLYKLIHSTL